MTTQNILALGNSFEYSETELKINGNPQHEELHESFADFFQGSFIDGVFSEKTFCELFGIKELKKPKKDVRRITITKAGESIGNNAAQEITTRILSLAHFISNSESKNFIDSEFEKFFDFINFLINETK